MGARLRRAPVARSGGEGAEELHWGEVHPFRGSAVEEDGRRWPIRGGRRQFYMAEAALR